MLVDHEFLDLSGNIRQRNAPYHSLDCTVRRRLVSAHLVGRPIHDDALLSGFCLFGVLTMTMFCWRFGYATSSLGSVKVDSLSHEGAPSLNGRALDAAEGCHTTDFSDRHHSFALFGSIFGNYHRGNGEVMLLFLFIYFFREEG